MLLTTALRLWHRRVTRSLPDMLPLKIFSLSPTVLELQAEICSNERQTIIIITAKRWLIEQNFVDRHWEVGRLENLSGTSAALVLWAFLALVYLWLHCLKNVCDFY